MDYDKEIKLLAAETLAIQTVLGHVFQEVAMVDSRIAAAIRRGFEKLMPSSSRRSGNAQIALLSRNRPGAEVISVVFEHLAGALRKVNIDASADSLGLRCRVMWALGGTR